MSTSAAHCDWLPDHQLHVAPTLAHVDQLIAHITRIVHDYTDQGPLALTEVVHGDRFHLKVTAVAPIPGVLPRLVADALTQLRAALEHTLYAEVEHLLQRPLTDQEARCIEMPACTEPARFDTWLAHGRRSRLIPLAAGTVLAERIRALQPFQRRDVEDHPLRLLAEHTNLAKHRTPAVAATRLGAVYPDRPHPPVSPSHSLWRATRSPDTASLSSPETPWRPAAPAMSALRSRSSRPSACSAHTPGSGTSR